VSGDVSIDRLVLELRALDAAAARTLALGIAEGLSGADIDGHHVMLSASIDAEAPADPQSLAAHIVETLLQRIG